MKSMRSRSKKAVERISVPVSATFETVFQQVSPDCLVGIGYRRVVEVAAEDQRGAGRLYDGMYLAGLLGSFHEIALYGVLQLVDAVQVSDDVILLDALDERPALRDAGRLHVHVYDSDGSAVDRKVAPQAVVAAILERDYLPVRDRIFAEYGQEQFTVASVRFAPVRVSAEQRIQTGHPRMPLNS